MGIWDGALAEARDDGSFAVLGVLLAAAVLVRIAAPDEGPRLRGGLMWAALHLALLPVAGALRADGLPAYREVSLVALVFEALAVIGIAALLLFAVLLPRVGVQTPRILRDLVVAAAALVTCFVLASRAGLNISGLIATSTVLTAVIGLSLQDTLGNVMAGLALQMDESVQVGDWIKVGDVSGRVSEVGWRATSVETRNWETMVIPNSVLVRNTFLVLGRRSAKPVLWRRFVYFNVDFRYPPSDVIAAVHEAVRAAPLEHVAGEPAPQCVLMDLHDSYGQYALRYWLTDLAFDDPTDSAVRTRIYFALRRAGIPLSIPAQAVFLTQESPERREAKSREEAERRRQALAHVDLFDHLSDEDRARLAASLRYAPFARGEVLTRQGEEALWLYLIVAGEAVVRVSAGEGMEREVARLKAGNFFGEMALMTGALRSATVVAITDVECYRLDKAAFQDVIRERPELAERIAELLARRRVALETARENLDAEALQRRLTAAQRDLLGRVRRFFGLPSPSGS